MTIETHHPLKIPARFLRLFQPPPPIVNPCARVAPTHCEKESVLRVQVSSAHKVPLCWPCYLAWFRAECRANAGARSENDQ